jgi:uncharacterized protein DUF6894
MRDARYLRGQADLCLQVARQTSDPKAADQLRAEAARYHAEATEIEGIRIEGMEIEGMEPSTPGYSLKFTNGLQTIQDTRGLELSTGRAARREASRTAREMAGSVSWQSSARGAGWTVLVMDPMGQQVCEVPVRLKNRWLDVRTHLLKIWPL